VDGKRVQPGSAHRYLLLNKPKGYLPAVSDPQGRPTVLDLVPPALRRALVPVGRLDFHTEGLLLLTDDGELANRVSHPRFGCHKTYEVKAKGVPDESKLDRLRRGVVLDGRRTSPAKIEPLRRTKRGEETGNSWFRVELSEGRTRQIREMFFRIGHPVQKLRRIAIGPLTDPQLPVGGLRELEESEVRALERATRGAAAGEGRSPGSRSRGSARTGRASRR
jgi:pseudouridine synthase